MPGTKRIRFYSMHYRRGMRLGVWLLVVLAAGQGAAWAAAAAATDGSAIVVETIGKPSHAYQVPAPAGAKYDQNMEGIFSIASAPFKHAFTGHNAFYTHNLVEPNALYAFSYYANPDFSIIGDGHYLDLWDLAYEENGLSQETFQELEKDERRKVYARITELRKSVRMTSDPEEMLACMRRIAARAWDGPNLHDIKKNGGDQYPYFFTDAVVTTTHTALPPVGDDALATHLALRIATDQLPLGNKFVDISENALYFVLGPKVIKLSCMDLRQRSAEEIAAELEQWRQAIVQANPTMR